jgi:hypothetical protein
MLAVPAALALGCTHGYVIPASHVSAPEASLRAARQAGAEGDPHAAVHVHLAQRELAMAHSLMRSGDSHQADWMLMAAYADAELARSMARKQQAQRHAQAVAVPRQPKPAPRH